MPDELIRPRVAKYYAGKLAEHGATPRGVDWSSAESQALRFDQIVRLIEAPGPLSINDVGCGYGAFAEHLERRGIEARLHGLDLAEAMVAAARERLPGQRWTSEPAELETAEYTICSGIFNVRLDIGDADWVDYVWETLDQMHAISSKGMIFNMLTGHSDPERMRGDLFYADPGEWLDACMRRYGRDAALLHDYPLYEFTMLIGAGGTMTPDSGSQPAVIFGVGDFARIASVYLREDSPYEVVAFTVHERYIEAPELNGIPVVPFESLEQSHPPGEVEMLVAVGFSRVNRARAEVFAECKQRGYRLLSYVHSGVRRWEETTIGENCFVFEENVIQPFVRIGDDVVLWSGNHIGHDTRIGDHCFIASHAVVSGNVTIGDYSFVGVNATFRDGISVGERNVIGAGAVVMRDTEDGDVLVPAASAPIGRKSWDLKGF